MTLTTAVPWEELKPEIFRRGVAQVVQRLRRRYGRCEYFAAVEFTTGRARRSGGRRRLHAHALIKAAEGLDVVEVEQLVRETWQRVTDAYVVEVAELVSPGAALGYLSLHHRKASQAPPSAWRGMTERASRGYFRTPIAELRAEARKQLASEAIAHRNGWTVDQARMEIELRGPARLLVVRQAKGSALVEPMWRDDLGDAAYRVPGRVAAQTIRQSKLSGRE